MASSAAAPSTFSAWRYSAYGKPADVLQKDTLPVPKAEDVPAGFLLVRVRAAATNPVDFKLVDGTTHQWGFASAHFPSDTPGLDFSGDVVAVGPDVTGFSVGDRIAANIGVERNRPGFDEFVNQPAGPYGAFAEYTLVLARNAAVVDPAVFDYQTAAAIPLAGVTSWQALVDHAKMATDGSKKQKILIIGGAGGTGSFGVQIAKAFGHFVATTASTRNIEFVKGLGADQVIDYSTTNWWEELAGQDFDIIYNSVSHVDTLGERGHLVLREGGYWANIVGGNGEKGKDGYNESTFVLTCKPGAEKSGLQSLIKLVADGKVKVNIDRTFQGFDELPKSLEYQSEGKARGKIVTLL